MFQTLNTAKIDFLVSSGQLVVIRDAKGPDSTRGFKDFTTEMSQIREKNAFLEICAFFEI